MSDIHYLERVMERTATNYFKLRQELETDLLRPTERQLALLEAHRVEFTTAADEHFRRHGQYANYCYYCVPHITESITR